MIGIWAAASVLFLGASTPACSPEQMGAILSPEDTPVSVNCSVTLQEGQNITRPMRLQGPQASGTTIDCQGGTIGREGRVVTTAEPTIAIWSAKDANGQWQPPTHITVRNCHIIGNVRIWGMGADGRYDELRASSHTSDHTRRLQDTAPTHITLEALTLSARGSIPLYVGPGVTHVRLTGSAFDGSSNATAVYLDAESGHHTITGNHFATRTGREVLAVDGSAHNRITDNRFELHRRAGIYLYRNCGERGVIRHQTPSYNLIADNHFRGASWLRPRLVVENARNGRRSYCGDDAGYPFGSSVDDRDNATGNVIRNNHR